MHFLHQCCAIQSWAVGDVISVNVTGTTSSAFAGCVLGPSYSYGVKARRLAVTEKMVESVYSRSRPDMAILPSCLRPSIKLEGRSIVKSLDEIDA